MINIQNRLRKIEFNVAAFEKKAATVLDFLGYKDFDLNILLTTSKSVRKYNKQFRSKDKATDILSFPFHPELVAGDKIKPLTDDDKAIGDIIISLEYVLADKHKLGGTFLQRMDRMLVHGVCHCLGHDHIEDEEYKIMFALEKKLLSLIQN
jgi:probable rRNA maturation factor